MSAQTLLRLSKIWLSEAAISAKRQSKLTCSRGEQAATVLENGLTSVEQKINALLERAEADEAATRAKPSSNGQSKDHSVGFSKS